MRARPTVIVTGSAGLLGSPVCTRLADAGYEVFAFDRPGVPDPPTHHPHITDVDFEATDKEVIGKAIEYVRQHSGDSVASVVHLAAYYDFSGEDSPLYRQVTVDGTARLLDALRACHVEQFLFSSTMLVHSPCEVGKHIRETDPLEAKWPYPQSKIETEKLIREKHGDIRSVLLRIAGVYTDWGTQPTLVQQIKRIYEKDFQGHFFPGDQDTGQSAIYLDDVVDSIVRCVDDRSSIPDGQPILIGEADPPSYALLQDRISELIHGESWSTLYVPPALAKVGAAVTDTISGGDAFIKPFMVDMADDHYALDISLAKRLLGWEPKNRLIDHLPIIVKRLLDNPKEWYERNGLDPEDVP